MDLKELKEKFPETAVVEFREDAVYLLIFNENFVARREAQEVAITLESRGIHTAIVMAHDPSEAVRAFELKS